MATHTIKILPEYFAPTSAGKKAFELRKNDRDYKVGDKLVMQEWSGTEYTGRVIHAYITYIFNEGKFGLADGYCALGTRIINIIIPKKND